MVSQTALILAVDRIYKDRAGDLSLITGDVHPDTAEYDLGLRFYDHNGILYYPDGRTPESPTSADIIREASHDEYALFKEDRPRFIVGMLDDQGYFAVGSPQFRLTRNGQYINRMGVVLTETELDIRDPFMPYVYLDHASMNDIICQINPDYRIF